MPEFSFCKEWRYPKTETPANDRGRFLYLYFQFSEIGRVKWHISEERFCRGFKLKPAAAWGGYEICRWPESDL
jgi:hypothetical protein